MQDKKTLDLFSIATIPLIMTLGNSMLIPILPMMARELDITTLQVSLVITIYSIAAVIFIPFAGFLSDRIGRKKVLIPALVLSGMGALVAGVAAQFIQDSYMWILVGRLIQGIGAAGAFPIVIPLVGDMFTQKEDVSRGLGMIETSNTLGKVLSPILGALLAVLVWYAPFYVFPIMCVLSLIAVAILLKVPEGQGKKLSIAQYWQQVKTSFKQKGRWMNTIFMIGLFSLFIVFGVLFYLSTVLEDEYQIDGVIKGVYLAIPLGVLSIVSFLTGKWIGKNKKRMKKIIIASAVLMAGALAVLRFTDGLLLMMICFSVMSIGIGAILPSLDALITEGVQKEERGMITSVYSSMRYVGVAGGPPVFSVFMKFSTSALFYINIALSLLIIVATTIWIRPEGGKVKRSIFSKME